MNARFAGARDEYARLMNDRAYVDQLLEHGAMKARAVASGVLTKVMKATGIRP